MQRILTVAALWCVFSGLLMAAAQPVRVPAATCQFLPKADNHCVPASSAFVLPVADRAGDSFASGRVETSPVITSQVGVPGEVVAPVRRARRGRVLIGLILLGAVGVAAFMFGTRRR